MESIEDSPDASRHFGNDESVAALLPHTQSPRDPRTGRKSTRTYGLDGSGGTNPARRFWTRLRMVLRPRSNSSFGIPLTKPSKSGFDLVFSSKRPVVTEAEASRALVVEVE